MASDEYNREIVKLRQMLESGSGQDSKRTLLYLATAPRPFSYRRRFFYALHHTYFSPFFFS